MNGDEAPLTKRDLREALEKGLSDLKTDLKSYILEREISAVRWFLAVQLAVLTAFSGLILGGVYFIVAHLVRHA